MSKIHIDIKGQFVSKSTKNAGSAGAANTTSVTISFDDEWTGFAKRIIWLDSKGENKTSILLVPKIADSTTVYETYIPSEVTKEEGWCSFCIEGYYDSNPEKILKSVADELFVSYSYANEGISAPTPDEAIQLHREFEALMPEVNAALEASKDKINETCSNINKWENYNESTLYKEGNKVTYNGRCYVCLSEVVNVAPENTSYWLMIADRGEKGETGLQGLRGVRGETGDRGAKGDKGEKGDKGDKGDAGINATVVPSNGFYSFDVDADGNLWLNFPDSKNPPDASINENGELILVVEGNDYSINAGQVKGEKGEDGYTPKKGIDYFTAEDIKSLNIPEKEKVEDNDAALKRMMYYGDASIVPSDVSFSDWLESYGATLFKFSVKNENARTASVTRVYNNIVINTEEGSEGIGVSKIIVPYECIIGGKTYTITSIENSAFENCDVTILKSVIIPASVKSIGNSAFYSCSSLTDIIIPNSVINIGEDAFLSCSRLANVYFRGTKSEWDAIEIAQGNGCLLDANIHYEWTDVTKGYVDEKMGDIDSALDNIIAIQNTLIGGDAE